MSVKIHVIFFLACNLALLIFWSIGYCQIGDFTSSDVKVIIRTSGDDRVVDSIAKEIWKDGFYASGMDTVCLSFTQIYPTLDSGPSLIPNYVLLNCSNKNDSLIKSFSKELKKDQIVSDWLDTRNNNHSNNYKHGLKGPVLISRVRFTVP